MPRRYVCVLPGLLVLSCLHAAAQAPKPAPVSCTIRRTPATAGDTAIANSQWSEAIAAYQTEIQAAGEEGDRAHNGLIRAELGGGKVADAEKDAKEWLAKSPANPWALDAMADVSFRKGELDKASDAFRTAATQSFCNARVHADYARYLSVVGYKASALSQLNIARKLDPIDRAITANLQSRATESATPGACHLVSTTPKAVIPFRAIRDGNDTNGQHSYVKWGLDVGMNGNAMPRRLQIATDTHGIILTRAAAVAAGIELPPAPPVSADKRNEVMTYVKAHANTVKVGGLEFQDCDVQVLVGNVMVTAWDADRKYLEDQDGFIGTDLFQDYLVTLDFPGKQMRLDPLPALPPQADGKPQDPSSVHDRYVDPSMATWTKFTRVGPEIIIPVRLNKTTTRLFSVETENVDSISVAAAKEIKRWEKFAPGTVYSTTGEVKHLDSATDVTFEFGNFNELIQSIYAMDLTDRSKTVEISGTLGPYILHQLTLQIDYRDQLAHFNFERSRLAPCQINITVDDCYTF